MSKMFRSLAVAAVATVASWLPLSASAVDKFNELIIISGSLSDIGNFAAVNGPVFPAPLFIPGRSTNGKNVDDFFAEALGFQNTPSLHLVGPVQGNNFAVFQSLARGNGPNDLPAQIDAYLGSKGGKANPAALHLVLIGGTDVIDAALEPDDRKSSQIIDGAVAGIETAIRRLVRAGAFHIFAPNFADLGITPTFIKTGTTKRATRISIEYNVKFGIMLNRIERQLKMDLIRWDFFKFTQDFFRHPGQFGFDNTTEACVDVLASGRSCDPNRFLFLAEVFPSTRLHQIFAASMLDAFIEHRERNCRSLQGLLDADCFGNRR